MTTKDKLEKLLVALEYAKKQENELKIIRLKQDIKQVRDRLTKEGRNR